MAGARGGGSLDRMQARTRTTAPRRGHRLQAHDLIGGDDLRPLVVRPLVQTVDPDRLHNPDDITVDDAAIAAGFEHGGAIVRRGEPVRGRRGRKRSASRSRIRGGR